MPNATLSPPFVRPIHKDQIVSKELVTGNAIPGGGMREGAQPMPNPALLERVRTRLVAVVVW